MVIVGQKRALSLAVRDWRRAARYTALDGLLTGAVRFVWLRAGAEVPDDGADEDLNAWEGLTEAAHAGAPTPD